MPNTTPFDLKATLTAIEQQAANLHQQQAAMQQSIQALFQNGSLHRYQLLQINRKHKAIKDQYPDVPLIDSIPSWVQAYLDYYDYALSIRNTLRTAWQQVSAVALVHRGETHLPPQQTPMIYCFQWDRPGETTLETDIPLNSFHEIDTIDPFCITLTPSMLNAITLRVATRHDKNNQPELAEKCCLIKEDSHLSWNIEALEQALSATITARFSKNPHCTIDLNQSIAKLEDALLTQLDILVSKHGSLTSGTYNLTLMDKVLQLTSINGDAVNALLNS